MSRAAAAFGLALALGGATAGAADGDLARVMRALGEHRHRRAQFTETRDLAILDRPLESAGELIYDAPDRLEERLTRPRRERLIVDGATMTLERGGRSRSVDLARMPQVAALIGSIRSTLAGDQAALEQSFRLEFRGDARHWTLRLSPKAAALAARIEAIRIDGERDALLRVEIRETDGDRSTMRIEDEPR